MVNELLLEGFQFSGLGSLNRLPRFCPAPNVNPDVGLISQTLNPLEQNPLVDTDLNAGLALVMVTGTFTQVMVLDEVIAGFG